MKDDSRSQKRRFIPTNVKVAGACVLLTVLYFVFLFASMYSQFSQALEEFPKRHLDATPAIERAYAYFHEHGRWPTQANLETGGQRWLPPRWDYESDPKLGGPVIWRHGPWHMILVYYFAPPQQGVVTNIWTLSIEGNKRTFPADVGYSLQSAPEPRLP